MNKIITVSIVLFLTAIGASAQDQGGRRSRGEGLYSVVSSNTVGAWDLWVTGRAVGHIWDNPPDSAEAAQSGGSGTSEFVPSNVRGFPELAAELGLFDLATLTVESRVLSYGFNTGWISGAAKFTWPNNKKLRLNGFGAEFKYIYNFIDGPPTFGYRGFMPEGFVAKGHVAQIKFLYDLDLITKLSFLPFKLSANAGIRIPYTHALKPYSQYLAAVGLAYIGVDVDVFVEYSLEAFFNKSTEPKQFTKDRGQTVEIAFGENSMHLTPGARMRYPNGVNLYACVPLLLSANTGSGLKDGVNQIQQNYPEEFARGATQGYDPWFAKWMIVAQITVPFHYTQTSAEMMRNFLLLKNRPQRTRINVEEKLKGMNSGEVSDSTANQKSDQQRLDEIRKKREEMSK